MTRTGSFSAVNVEYSAFDRAWTGPGRVSEGHGKYREGAQKEGHILRQKDSRGSKEDSGRQTPPVSKNKAGEVAVGSIHSES